MQPACARRRAWPWVSTGGGSGRQDGSGGLGIPRLRPPVMLLPGEVGARPRCHQPGTSGWESPVQLSRHKHHRLV